MIYNSFCRDVKKPTILVFRVEAEYSMWANLLASYEAKRPENLAFDCSVESLLLTIGRHQSHPHSVGCTSLDAVRTTFT